MEKDGLFVGLIPDGNRSWAKKKYATKELSHAQLFEAYEAGANAVKKVIETARDLRLKVIATWGLSTKNMSGRNGLEKQVLFATFEKFLQELRDEWMDKPENKDVRLVHMGRKDRLSKEAKNVADLLFDVTYSTRKRTGMILALGLDYDGVDEETRAHGYSDRFTRRSTPVNSWKDWLDLPAEVEELRGWDEEGHLLHPVNLILRTRTEGDLLFRDNEYLHAYRHETRLVDVPVFLPDLTSDLFAQQVERYTKEKSDGKMKMGK